MVSSAITPTRIIAVLVGVAVIAIVGFAAVRSGVLDPETVQGTMPGPGSPSPSASESSVASPSLTTPPTPTTPAQIREKNIDDAKARLVEYYETTASVANNGYDGWKQALVPFWGSFEIRDAMGVVYTRSAEAGQYTTGAAEVESAEATSYIAGSGGYEEIGLEVCVDYSAVRTFGPDGREIERRAGVPTRYYMDYMMRHHGPDGVWAIDAEERHVERAC